MNIKIINKSCFDNPLYQTSGSAGMDLKADLTNSNDIKIIGKVTINSKELLLYPQSRVIIPTNLFIKLPEGYEAQIRPRSGQSFKKGFMVLNSPGTIDSDYTGNIGVIVANFTDSVIKIEHGERIAQMVISKYDTVNWVNVDVLDETDRKDGGFGSTGVK